MSAAAPPQESASLWTAWRHLFVLSFQRQWWSLQSLIAVVLFSLLATVVCLETVLGRGWDVYGFSQAVINGVYIGFLLPILCLCFGTNALGGDWEERSLVWLLTRPLPRPLIYAAKFLAAVPWTFGLTLGGLFLLGVLGENGGWAAVTKFWPAVAWGTLTYLTLFVLIGAAFRHSTVVAVVYAFVLETIIGNMPGLVKRVSIGFYSRSMLYGLAQDYGLHKQGKKPGIAPGSNDFFYPVPSDTAVMILAVAAVGLFVVGIVVFSRREYRDLT